VVSIKAAQFGAFLIVCLGGWPRASSSVLVADDVADDLHAQSAAVILQRKFSSPDLSYLLLDGTGREIAHRWEAPERELPVGSLIKPFIALAYGRTHQSFPAYRCTGKKTCWLPQGHGPLAIRRAIAFSCNSYFRQLYAHAEPGFAEPMLKQFKLSAETDGASGSAEPAALAQAFVELASQPRDRASIPVLDGMELAAREGTAKAAGAQLPQEALLAKTGTASCTHSRRAPGDGFAVLLMPADHPRLALLVRVHGKPGSFAAGIAGQMMAAVEGNGAAE
jgi:cell division protein FtsI/penicillin-binding protein 2